MNDLNVRIVRLEALRVAAAHGFGANPEDQAWQKLLTWAKSKGLDDLKAHRFLGFNNPNPSAGSPNYGYEQWMTVKPDVTAEGEVTIKDFPGGLYAVLRCPGIPNPDIWRKLVLWRESSAYKGAQHQWLEECLNPGAAFEQWEFDLYLPIAE
jgi:DNA gyrase inhibitor GyrI